MKYKLFFMAFFSSGVMALDLTSGVGITAEIENALWDTSIPYAIARQGQRSLNTNRSVIAFIEQPTFIWSLSSDSYLLQTTRADRKVSGSWHIEPFSDPELEPEIQTLYSGYELTPTPRTYENLLPILGCYIQNPLRYGDITNDGEIELAVFAQDEYGALNINLFSPTVKKVIFSGRIATYDARINERLTLADSEQESASNPLANDPTNGQYLSGIAEDNTRMVKGIQKAVVGLSKIYIDDFNGDEVQELIQWRKLYKSRENKDPIKGFEKIRDTYIHYKLIDGEYQKQSTEQSVITGWLEAKNLTWQKGYPSKSECPSQEGQLIPEMHDPLLNDPDVLE
jgi:hypothetical protein